MNFIKSLFNEMLIIVIVVPIIIIGFFVYRKVQRNKAARAETERKRRIQEEANAKIEEYRRESAERERKAKEIRERKEREKEREIEEAIRSNPGSEKYRLNYTQTESSVDMMNITTFTPISKQRYVAFDLETTGLKHNADAIVEIGAVRVENGEITEEFHQFIDPERPMPAEVSAINHITDDMLTGMPKIHQVLPAFLAFIGDDVIAAHNASFDYRFIAQQCMRNRFRIPEKIFDTMTMAKYWPEAENRKLTSLAAAACIPAENAHHALDDAKMVAGLIAATNKRRAESRKRKS